MVRSYRDVLAESREAIAPHWWLTAPSLPNGFESTDSSCVGDEAIAPLCLTDNGAVAFESTLSSCVDFFFDVMQNSEEAVVKAKLDAAWHEDPLIALKLLFHLRDVRHGKGARLEAFYGFMHLYQHHPATLLANIRHIPASGCWKDLLQLCEYAYYGRVSEHSSKKQQKKRKLEGEPTNPHNRQRQRNVPAASMQLEDIAIGRLTGTVPRSVWRARLRSLSSDEERQAAQAAFRDAAERYQQAVLSFNAAEARRRHVQDRHEAMHLQLEAQPAFRGVYDACADAFAAALSRDRDTVAAGGSLGLDGLAGKWAPTPGHAADREMDLAHAIASRMYPACAGEAENAARQRALREYRRMLTPLRAAAAVPEQQMSAKAWSEVIYERVPSVCMTLNKKHFLRHDSERFQQYLDAVDKGEKKIASGALLPHQLVQQAREFYYSMDIDDPELKTVELQWQSYVQQLRSLGTLGSTLAVCDVSGSMCCTADAKTGATCKDVAIALSLLLCEIADPPCKDTVCSFHDNPQLLRLTGTSLMERIRQLENMHWGMNTNIDRVFDLLLGLAKVNQLAPERMVRTVYIFSDMQFDVACRGTKTNFQHAKAKFEQAGYKLPGIVFWNLQGEHGPRGGSTPKPITRHEDGTALISGYSGMLLKRLLTMGELADPHTVMMECLDGLYDYLEVVD